MLVADLFRVAQQEVVENKLTAVVAINAENSLFDGHFPNNPVAPGVMQVQLIKELLEIHFQKELELQTMSRCKFLAILNPVKTPEIEVEIDFSLEDDQISAKATGKSSSEVFFKFFATYK